MDKFRVALNNAIQNLRTVTFVLQKNKKLIDNFVEWYDEWQNKMRDDKIMKWSVSSRNEIVKQGDLVTLSKAKASLIERWEDDPIFEVEVSPETNYKSLAQVLARVFPKKELLVGIIKLEREWIHEKLPGHELLSNLIHCYAFLVRLLKDAHRHVKDDGSGECSWLAEVNLRHEFLPPSLIGEKWDRSILIEIDTGQIFTPGYDRIYADRSMQEEAVERYSFTEKVTESQEVGTCMGECKFLFSMAKSILEKDGFHIPTAFLTLPSGEKQLVQLGMTDRATKHMLMRLLANEIRKTGASRVSIIFEAWLATIESNPKFTKDGIICDGKKECLLVITADKCGNIENVRAIFSRKEDGSIKFEKEESYSENLFQFIAPVLEVWSS